MDERSYSGMRRRPRVGMGEGSSARGRVGAAGERGQGRNGGDKPLGGLGQAEVMESDRRQVTWQSGKLGCGRRFVHLAHVEPTGTRWMGRHKGLSDKELPLRTRAIRST